MPWRFDLLALSLILSLALPTALRAEPRVYRLAPDSTLSYFVRHPMHDVKGESGDIKLLKEPSYDPANPTDMSGLRDIPLQAAWASFSSGNANRDANTSLVVKASQFPTITYVIESVDVVTAAADGVHHGTVAGRLYIAGQKQAVTASVDIDSRDPERIVVRSKTQVKMTDFGIEPPKLLLFAAEDSVAIETTLYFAP